MPAAHPSDPYSCSPAPAQGRSARPIPRPYALHMHLSRALEQHIAVFGESGSGKTVLLSSFYGATQEPQYLKNSRFYVVADNVGQGNRLHKNYLGMRDSAQVPAVNRF